MHAPQIEYRLYGRKSPTADWSYLGLPTNSGKAAARNLARSFRRLYLHVQVREATTTERIISTYPRQ